MRARRGHLPRRPRVRRDLVRRRTVRCRCALVSHDLRADCGSCFGLCCVAPAFAASADFAIDKPAGTPARTCRPTTAAAIHADLRERGFPGCTVYDCFGAGQQVSQVTFGGRRLAGRPRARRADVRRVRRSMRQLHELLWYLAEALALPRPRPLRRRARRRASPRPSAQAGWRRTAPRSRRGGAPGARERPAAREAASWSEPTSRGRGARRPARRRPDRGRPAQAPTCAAPTCAARYLIGADLRGADLRLADLIGADLRGADLRGADLAGALFLTQSQVNAARGDERDRAPRSACADRCTGSADERRTSRLRASLGSEADLLTPRPDVAAPQQPYLPRWSRSCGRSSMRHREQSPSIMACSSSSPFAPVPPPDAVPDGSPTAADGEPLSTTTISSRERPQTTYSA